MFLSGYTGASITALQIIITATSYSREANPETCAKYSKFAHKVTKESIRRLAIGINKTAQKDTPGDKKIVAEEKEKEEDATTVPSQIGMLFIYMPPFVLCSVLYYLDDDKYSFFPTKTAAMLMLCIHYAKRVLEVLFLHVYSGSVELVLSLVIGIFYALTSYLICYVSSTSADPSSPLLSICGYSFFVIGLLGNLYHHYLLRNLRSLSKMMKTKYVAPRGGLFEYVATPHYLFELIGWLGIAIIAQHINAYLVFFSMSSYLSGRSVLQNKWNSKRFSEEEWPSSRRNLIPGLF